MALKNLFSKTFLIYYFIKQLKMCGLLKVKNSYSTSRKLCKLKQNMILNFTLLLLLKIQNLKQVDIKPKYNRISQSSLYLYLLKLKTKKRII